MFLLKFLETIENSFLGKTVQGKMEVLHTIDPNRIYVENIRSFFGFPYGFAKFLCDLAVNAGSFKKVYAATCPNCGRIITTSDYKDGFLPIITCGTCELLEEEFEFDIDKVKIITFYRLNKVDGATTV